MPTHIKTTVTTSAKKYSVVFKNDRYHVTTKEPAKQGRANTSAKLLLAEYLGVPPNKLSLININREGIRGCITFDETE